MKQRSILSLQMVTCAYRYDPINHNMILYISKENWNATFELVLFIKSYGNSYMTIQFIHDTELFLSMCVSLWYLKFRINEALPHYRIDSQWRISRSYLAPVVQKYRHPSPWFMVWGRIGYIWHLLDAQIWLSQASLWRTGFFFNSKFGGYRERTKLTVLNST